MILYKMTGALIYIHVTKTALKQLKKKTMNSKTVQKHSLK